MHYFKQGGQCKTQPEVTSQRSLGKARVTMIREKRKPPGQRPRGTSRSGCSGNRAKSLCWGESWEPGDHRGKSQGASSKT